MNYYNTSYLYVGHDATIGATRSLVKWPTLPDIPNAEVLGGQIGFYQYHAYSQIAPVGMHKVTTSGWAHDKVTWNALPSFNASAESTLGSLVTGYNYFEATSLIKEWYANPQANNGVIFKYADSQENSNTRRSFYSSDWINPDRTSLGKPKLVISFRKLVISFRSKEFLGLADYWKFTPDIFQGEGTGVVNVINGNCL
ncbi:DNRLRE domain-containing protein [Desulfosporosinus nitroreducens]|uniref:DNRLRE domain-containing protein n=1 Tax=Desulfosporosinus nitroreducens TaxID=2018668 RepID=A0ABT8QL00_9FIRM|nr:DNRLRE domain-containing protein [Desulfosporosinus nitroreducens]